MKKLLAQFGHGDLVGIYKSPEEAALDDHNRYNAHEIEIATLSNVTYRGFEWKWIDRDDINALKRLGLYNPGSIPRNTFINYSYVENKK